MNRRTTERDISERYSSNCLDIGIENITLRVKVDAMGDSQTFYKNA